MLQRLEQLATARENFAFETTLASRSFAPWISRLRESGYEFHLLYFWLTSAEMAIARVKERVLSGGHDVPADTIIRRYSRGIRNFFELYAPLATSWRAYNNVSREGARLIASGGVGKRKRVYRDQDWSAFQAAASEADPAEDQG